MDDFEEHKRIKKAIETHNLIELVWAKSCARKHLDEARNNRPNSKTSRKALQEWTVILEQIDSTLDAVDTALYNQWIKSLFDKDERKGDWRFDLDEEPIAVPEELLCCFVYKLNNELPELLKTYSDWQIATGLDYIFNPSCSNYSFTIRDGPSPLEMRLMTIESMKNLYRDCFEINCEPVLAQTSEQGSKFNLLCYMLWDVTAISYCKDHREKTALLSAVTNVLHYALSMKNPACIESAIHGLGHLVYYYPEAAEVIQDFINQPKGADPLLLRYAEAAKTGCIL